jgi:hypothetical protein
MTAGSCTDSDVRIFGTSVVPLDILPAVVRGILVDGAMKGGGVNLRRGLQPGQGTSSN